MLEPATLLTRIEIHVEEEIRAKRLPPGSFAVLREAVIAGQLERVKIRSLTGHGERGARNVTAALVNRGMLTASSHRAPLRLASRDHEGVFLRSHGVFSARCPPTLPCISPLLPGSHAWHWFRAARPGRCRSGGVAAVRRRASLTFGPYSSARRAPGFGYRNETDRALANVWSCPPDYLRA
nr:hypothetical protein [uncultured Rhodopila sp.]